MLGKLYLMGQGVEYDKSMGAHWLSQSAAQGNAYANSLLKQQNSGRPPNVFLGVTRLFHHMGRIFQEHSLPQSNPGGIQIDHKRLEKLQEKREAHGLKGNVYRNTEGQLCLCKKDGPPVRGRAISKIGSIPNSV